MRPAAGIVSPGHALHGARVRPIGLGRSVVLLEAHGHYPAFARLSVPQGMLSDDGTPDAAGTVYTLARAAGTGYLLRLRAAVSGSSTCISAWVPYNGASVRGWLRLNTIQSGGIIGYTDPVDLSVQLEAHHPATGEDYIIRPDDLQRAAALAAADAEYKGARSVIVAPYHQLDGARCRVTGAESTIPWPCDVTSPQRCLKTDISGYSVCTCTATGRSVVIIDDVEPAGAGTIWLHVGNADIMRAGLALSLGPEQLASDAQTPTIRTACLRCSRLAPIGAFYCPAHASTV